MGTGKSRSVWLAPTYETLRRLQQTLTTALKHSTSCLYFDHGLELHNLSRVEGTERNEPELFVPSERTGTRFRLDLGTFTLSIFKLHDPSHASYFL